MRYFAYIRVSTDAQDVANQRHGIEEYATKSNIEPKYIEDTASGKKAWKERELGKLLDSMKSGDSLLVAEISRLARSTLQVLEILEYAAKHEINVYVVKTNLHMDGSMHSRITATILGLAAEIEREFISARTKEALAYRKAQGKHIGRPQGAKNKEYIVGKEERREIKKRLKHGETKTAIAKEMNISRQTLYRFLETLKEEPKEPEEEKPQQEETRYGLVMLNTEN